MATISDFRNGMVIDLDGELYTVVEFLHVKPGKGAAFLRSKLKNIRNGRVLEKTFRPSDKITEVKLERKDMQYIYNTGDLYYLMDMDTFEQIPVSESIFSECKKFLKENMLVGTMSVDGNIIAVELPFHVELEIVETEPGIRGDTVSGSTKPAKLESGAVIQVPLFVEIGDVIRVDTRTGTYIERV